MLSAWSHSCLDAVPTQHTVCRRETEVPRARAGGIGACRDGARSGCSACQVECCARFLSVPWASGKPYLNRETFANSCSSLRWIAWSGPNTCVISSPGVGKQCHGQAVGRLGGSRNRSRRDWRVCGEEAGLTADCGCGGYSNDNNCLGAERRLPTRLEVKSQRRWIQPTVCIAGNDDRCKTAPNRFGRAPGHSDLPS